MSPSLLKEVKTSKKVGVSLKGNVSRNCFNRVLQSFFHKFVLVPDFGRLRMKGHGFPCPLHFLSLLHFNHDFRCGSVYLCGLKPL